MIIEFDSDEEYEKFMEYATSTEKSQGEDWDKLREKFRNHKRAKEGSLTAKELVERDACKDLAGKTLESLYKEGK